MTGSLQKDASTLTVTHVPFGYLPDTLGGTEVYVAGLARELSALGISSSIVAAGRQADYVCEGVPVKRIEPSQQLSLEALYSDGDLGAALEFGRAIDVTKPDLVHFHALTASASLAAIRESVRRRVPVILTYHTPTVSCLRGTMLLWGSAPCDGEMIVSRCTACTLHGKGIPKLIAKVVARVPVAISRGAVRMAAGKLSTLFGMRWLVTLRHQTTRAAFDICNRIIAPCEWVAQVLSSNGVATEKLFLSRQGLSKPAPKAAPDSADRANTRDGLRLVFLGRIHPTKGLHTLLHALALLPGKRLSLAIYGARSDDEVYGKLIAKLAAADSRVLLHDAISNEQIVTTIADFDLLVVPSEWLETGPLVVYEAFAAGIPVLGANIGGISELVSDGRNGRLVAAGDTNAWATAIAEIIDNSELLNEWRRNLPPIRTMKEVAQDMRSVYVQVARDARNKNLASGALLPHDL